MFCGTGLYAQDSDESLIYLLVFTWRFLNLVMWIDVANGLPVDFF